MKRPKHVVALKSHTFYINYTYSSCVLTYLSLLVFIYLYIYLFCGDVYPPLHLCACLLMFPFAIDTI